MLSTTQNQLNIHRTHEQDQQAILTLEAIIFASAEPIPLTTLHQHLLNHYDASVTTKHTQAWISALQQDYAHRSVNLVESNLGYQFQVTGGFATTIAQAMPERPIKLSQALLETLSIIAYQQPVTRGDIERIRGVSVNHTILKALFEKNWITEKGFRDIPGKPALLVTTKIFLDAFGLTSLTALPATIEHN